MVNYRLVWYLERNELLSSFQMGFRRHRSTIDGLIQLENAIQNSFAKRNHLVGISFDLEKAYDMTWKYGIIKQLQEWGLKGNLPKFIESFLFQRSFKVRVENTLSDEHVLDNGIPQGSTLSVTLFAFAINSLFKDLNPAVGQIMYVDDITIFFSSDNMDLIQRTLQQAINSLVKEAENKEFKFSVSKTNVMHFCRLRHPHNHPRLYMKSQLLECKPQTKFLGIIFDSKLYWKQHIEYLGNRCKRAMNVIRCIANINWGADKEVLLQLYRSMILSKISSARQSHLKILERIQSYALKLCLGAFPTSPLPSLQCLSGIPRLSLRIQQLTLCYGAAIWAQPHHPNYNKMYSNESLDLYESRTTITRPANIRMKELLELYNEELPIVYSTQFCKYLHGN
ncbi:hypothetical protein JTB14_028414 [Gonioctena quinquepunctata]|nr:hypothetical protein JTB14_028414 [Gonioctena quinquepunctata]